jgi:Organic radical activating enzymes
LSQVYYVSEIFVSIQGEGSVIGEPSNFVRLAGCHLRCVWCDTKYSWFRWEGKRMSVEDITNSLDKRVKNVTITGGEPLLYDLTPLAKALKEEGFRIIVETSGTIRPSQELRRLVDVFSVSPKLSNSGHKIKYDFRNEDWPTYFKFVIVDVNNDLDEVDQFVKGAGAGPEESHPSAQRPKEGLRGGLQELAQAVLIKGLPYRFSPAHSSSAK